MVLDPIIISVSFVFSWIIVPRKLVVLYVVLLRHASHITQSKVLSGLETCSIGPLTNFLIAIDLCVHLIELLAKPSWSVCGLKLRYIGFLLGIILHSCVVVRPILWLREMVEIVVLVNIRLFVDLLYLVFQRLPEHKVWKPVMQVL